ncbi:MAG: hypothetical protein HZY74_05510 [Brevundimonas sp.]|nr:MAG: hypothetical protein HZY74_05510 [Brevundimonas sp.]
MTAAVALHPKATTARRQSAAETCPAAALADEAADLVKAWHGLGDAIRPHRPRTWVGLASILGEPEPDAEEEISAQAVRTEIRERLEAIREFALHRRATSAKGQPSKPWFSTCTSTICCAQVST